MTTNDKLNALRQAMKGQNIDAVVIYSADPHMSEYLPKNWLERVWLSGFTGSAGFVVVTLDKSALWTDSRYFVQAPIELEGSEIQLMKDGQDGTPSYTQWLKDELDTGAVVAVNDLVTSHQNWNNLKSELAKSQITLKSLDLIKDIWTDRKEDQSDPIFVHPTGLAGKSVKEKLADIRESMDKEHADYHIITALDDVAWTLNLRGNDVTFNPVFLGYIVLDQETATLFVNENQVNNEVRQHLQEAHVDIKPYDTFLDAIKEIKGQTIWVSPSSNQAIYHALEDNNQIISKPAPGNLMKAIKNETELEGFRKVMVRDGVAMVKFIYWLKHEGAHQDLTEYEIGEKLRAFRAEGENFVGESFGSIVGYEGNGAIVHYSAKKDGSQKVKPKGSILVDSGGQYREGTTDITRTFALGEVTEAFINDCTTVLKGMIDLSLVHFPKGTKGVHLDAIARLPLWMRHQDFGHGTGHGVGSFMNVHEGPQNIRKDMNPQDLIPGMVLSNEPGFYVEGKYGIRHENLIAVKEVEKTESGTFYNFETLTICPFFKEVMNIEMLTEPQKDWLNEYHTWCKEKLEQHLEGEVKEWFLEVVEPI
ncbi:M24 family metallopeptidase [Flavobacteriaceae bacterium Ap0902]|nr:M24 family metallopeptidase [Flavobacteriaceae bacterium Ap0902]